MKGPSADAKNKHDWSGPRATLTGLSRRPLQRSPPLSHPKVRERTTGIMKAEMDLTTNWTPLWRSLSSPASSERTRVKVKDPVQQTTHLQQAFDRDIVHVAKLDPVPVLFTTEHLAGESDNATSPSVNVDLELMSIRHKLRLAVLRASRQPIATFSRGSTPAPVFKILGNK
ncbi:hypothetical protein RvY_00702 [Ramazzottius varieornatus]|uniref:Uncharacterized protein n=1 Tax=Ramazzottius varieornatus TaxID=947166 RepID=A0A1D1UE50_RAMVA|nr:hypothetical protein RvY_00702 [Ramazzottius varieornatus]